jgi:hypothetical protein
MSAVPQPDWSEVESYALARAKAAGDVYGWMQLQGEPARALFLVARNASRESFPKTIGGVIIKLRATAPPELQAGRKATLVQSAMGRLSRLLSRTHFGAIRTRNTRKGAP